MNDCVFCTLFDSNYIDKGLVLYDSMVEKIDYFKLYVFAFDDICADILKQENKENMIVISLSEFETEELLNVKKERTKAEYCWTCSPWIIKHVLEHYKEKVCTYVDADMMFFASPQFFFDEMRQTQKSVAVVSHGFESKEEEKKAHDTVGSYCVEFNTFYNDENGKRALDWWAQKCLEWCFYAVPGTTEWYGDQKYLNVIADEFDGVLICPEFGIGVAPWNVKLIECVKGNYEDGITIKRKNEEAMFRLVLYHFENVAFITKHILHASSRTTSDEIHKEIYDVYINKLLDKREEIESKYAFEIPKIRRVVTKNPIMKIYQKYISPFRRVKHLKDLYRD